MADIIPHHVMYLIMTGVIDLEDDTTYIDLIDNTYTPNADDDTFETGSDPYDSRCPSGNGYTQGAKEVSFTCADDDTNDRATADAPDISWTASGGNLPSTAARYAVIWDDTAANDPIIYILDLSSDRQAADGANFNILWDSDCIFDMAQA